MPQTQRVSPANARPHRNKRGVRKVARVLPRPKSEKENTDSGGEPFAINTFFRDVRPTISERYSLCCVVLALIGSILCFLPFYMPTSFHFNQDRMDLFDGSLPLAEAVDTAQFTEALLLSVIIAVPMLMDILLDAYYVFRFNSGRKLHWFARLLLLGSLTVPSILLLVRSWVAKIHFTTEDDGTAASYISVEAFKRIASTGCMFIFIAQEQHDSLLIQSRRKKLGFLSVLTFLTYVIAELLWLYSYSYQSRTSVTHVAGFDNPLRVAGAVALALALGQLLHLIAKWLGGLYELLGYATRILKRHVIQFLLFISVGWMVWLLSRCMGVCCYSGRKVGIVCQCCCCKCNADTEGNVVVSPRSMFGGTLTKKPPTRAVGKDRDKDRDKVKDKDKKNEGNDHKSESVVDTGSAKSSKKSSKSADFGDDFFLTGNWVHFTSRDICILLYFLMMISLPAVGFGIAVYCGNPQINSFQSSVQEISGYIYLQMGFTTVIIILPGWLARYELNFAIESLREKESFITQVAVEARNPLTSALENIKSVHEEMLALMPTTMDGNSAAERAILQSMLEGIDHISHATETAISTFTGTNE
jgi:hypothetical protein